MFLGRNRQVSDVPLIVCLRMLSLSVSCDKLELDYSALNSSLIHTT